MPSWQVPWVILSLTQRFEGFTKPMPDCISSDRGKAACCPPTGGWVRVGM